MPQFKVQTDLLVHTTVQITIEADSKEDALDKVAELLPSNSHRAQAKQWSATVALNPPPGIALTVLKAYHFEQTSGGEKVTRVKQPA